jgi:hypothetical protein
VRVLGEHAVTHACTDDYHRCDRRQRAELTPRDGLPHPDLSPFIGNGVRGITMSERGAERRVRIPGDIDAERAAGCHG